MAITVKYNNVSGANNFVTFTDVPNILSVTDSDSGTRARLVLTFSGALGVVALPPIGYWYITAFGETIASVSNYANAINKNFYASPSTSQSTAASVAKAFRNCPNLAANFTVEHNANQVIIEAREIGSVTFGIDTNISSSYITTAATSTGGATSALHGAKVDVDIFKDGSYYTTLEKNWYGGEAAFDMSPVLTTMAKVGETVPYTMKLSYISNTGGYNTIGNISTNYVAQGYMVNQGNKFLQLGSSPIFAQNVSRGNPKSGVSNHTTLYLYGSTIPYSLYMLNNGMIHIDIIYRNSAYEEFASNDHNPSFGGSSKLKDDEIQLSQQYLSGASYVDVKIEETGDTLRYSVIKPMKATEYWQRIRWRNSYGGWSFFDFTGAKTESRTLETSTYQKSIYDYYTSEVNELDKIYDNDVEYTVTLKSHIIDEDGKYLFNDLIQSPYVETIINSTRYAIIIDSVNIEETDRNNVYEVTVKYKYSMSSSII